MATKQRIKRDALMALALKDPKKAEALEQVTGMSIAELVEKTKLVDAHLEIDKAEGGEMEPANVDVLDPTDHMKVHDNFRARSPELRELKTFVDDRNQLMKLQNGISNRLDAYARRTDYFNPETKLHLEQQLAFTKRTMAKLTKRVEEAVVALDDPLANAALGIRGVGPVTVAYCLVYIDLAGHFPDTIPDKDGNPVPHPRAGQEKCPHASSVWKYVGLHTPSHERYEKGVKGGGNKTLRKVLYTFADSQVKSRGPYRDVYDRVKARRERSTALINGGGPATRNTQGKLIESTWKDAKPSHRDGDAKRQLIKHFLADWWFVGRDILGLPNGPCYATAQLGSQHRTVDPASRGWVWESAKSNAA